MGDPTDASDSDVLERTSWAAGEANAVATPGFPLMSGVVPLRERQRTHGHRHRRLGLERMGVHRLRAGLRRTWSTPELREHARDPGGERVLRRGGLHGDLPPRVGRRRPGDLLRHQLAGRIVSPGAERSRLPAALHRHGQGRGSGARPSSSLLYWASARSCTGSFLCHAVASSGTVRVRDYFHAVRSTKLPHTEV